MCWKVCRKIDNYKHYFYEIQLLGINKFLLLQRLEMKQREGHFLHLAEETAVLKDQVDSLRELSVISMKNENAITHNGYSQDTRMSDKDAKAHAATGIRSSTQIHYLLL